MPRPAIRMPVWPVARNSTSMPRRSNARASTSAVYFLPSAQSVPTVSRRLPPRLRPLGMLPGVVFYVAMLGYYHEIGDVALPSAFLLAKLQEPWFEWVFPAAVDRKSVV